MQQNNIHKYKCWIMYLESKGGLQNFRHSLEQRKWHPLGSADKEVDTISAKQHC